MIASVALLLGIKGSHLDIIDAEKPEYGKMIMEVIQVIYLF